jgi:TonB-dependent starch-binding outer membrane protein SusC
MKKVMKRRKLRKKGKPFLLNRGLLFIVFVLACFSVVLPINAQETVAWSNDEIKTVSGRVTDDQDYPIPGVTVLFEGTQVGVITDIDGRYSIVKPDNATILIFSFIGMRDERVELTGREVVNIAMKSEFLGLEEVVVIGYGTISKVNLTGSVAAVKVDEGLSSRSVTNVSSAMSGLLPGLEVIQNSGMAGKDGADLKIRGLGSLNNSNPLIVVDGMPDVDINRLNMNDIESVSVLKDAASAAIYGSRAANGVILITTKSGKGQDQSKFSYSGSYATVVPTRISNFMSDYAKALTIMQQETMPGKDRQSSYKDGTIDEWMAMGMIDPIRFPGTDWWDELTRKGVIQNHNISFSGGDDKTNFFISGGMMDNKGIMENNDFARYNFRMNYEYKLKRNMNVGARISGNSTKWAYVFDDGFTESGNSEIFTSIAGVYPYDPATGRFGGAMAYGEDPQISNMKVKVLNQLTHQNRQEANGIFFVDWSPVRGLTAKAEAAINYYNQFAYEAPVPTGLAYNFQRGVDLDRAFVGDNAGIKNQTRTGYKTLVNYQLRYERSLFGNHNLSALVVYSEEYWYNRRQDAFRSDRIHPSLKEIDAALKTDSQSNGGSSDEEGLNSIVGRLNYTIKDRYMLEVNSRYDGSSRFYEGYQYGFFPSVSAAWRFTEEGFLNPLLGSWLTLGKLRASYGSLGNNSGVGLYEQKEVLATTNYMVDGKVVKGFVNKKMINRNFSWETTTVLNIGLDLGFFNNKLTVEADYYNRLTTGMIAQSELSNHLTGAYDAPRINNGDLRNKGVELNVNWQDRISSDLRYSVNFNVSHNQNKLEKYNELLLRGWRFLDMPWEFLYTYENTGIVQTWDEIYNSTPQGASPGDILRKDLNGDGRIDGKDQKAYPNIQRQRPTTFFALNTSISYKGFDLAVLLQGSAGRKDFFLNPANQVSFPDTKYAVSEWHGTNPWNLDRREGIWPRLGGYGTNQSEGTFWLDNMAFLRLKNLQLGYALPKSLLTKAGVSNLRFYISTENLFTFTNYRGLDPEKTGRREDIYPINKSYTFGINLDF